MSDKRLYSEVVSGVERFVKVLVFTAADLISSQDFGILLIKLFSRCHSVNSAIPSFRHSVKYPIRVEEAITRCHLILLHHKTRAHFIAATIIVTCPTYPET
jgi:hypothetical protein